MKKPRRPQFFSGPLEKCGMTDTEIVNWLEAFVREHGALVLHMGNANCGGNLGLGLEPGYVRRSLRKAVEQAAGRANGRL